MKRNPKNTRTHSFLRIITIATLTFLISACGAASVSDSVDQPQSLEGYSKNSFTTESPDRPQRLMEPEAAAEPQSMKSIKSAPMNRSKDSRSSSSTELYRSSEDTSEYDRSGPATDPGTGPSKSRAAAPYAISAIPAGQVNDNEQWQAYLSYIQNYAGPPVNRVPVQNRRFITVLDANQKPILGAEVQVKVNQNQTYKAETYANGQTLYYPSSQDLNQSQKVKLTANDGTRETSVTITNPESEHWTISINSERPEQTNTNLDILFLLDSTGSMQDEIDQIKSTLLSIAERVNQLSQQPNLRFAMLSYRDLGDDYVTKLYDFEDNPRAFSNQIRNVQADGGNDTPESLNQAFHEALHKADWRSEPTVKLIFLIADAPPHLDYSQDVPYSETMLQARQRGIKVFSVASSGLNQQGEYILRQIAQQTMGKFLFILYEGAQGALDTPHQVGKFTVDKLDDLIVTLIQEELDSAAATPSEKSITNQQ